MKKILALLMIIFFLSCKKSDVTFDNSISQNHPNINLSFSKEEQDLLLNFSSHNFNVIDLSLNKNNSISSTIKLKYNFYDFPSFSIDFLKNKNILYFKNSFFTILIKKESINNKIYYEGQLLKTNNLIQKIDGDSLLIVLSTLNNYFENFLKENLQTITDEEFDNYSNYVFGEDESLSNDSILYNQEKRGFSMDNIVSVSEKSIENKKYLRIYNPLPHNFEDLFVLGQVSDKHLILFKLDVLRAFSENLYPLEFFSENMKYVDLEGKSQEIEGLENITSYKLYTDDNLFEKLSKIKATNIVKFGYRVGGKWSQLHGEDAKRYIPGLVNIYYMLSTDEFYNNFVNDNNVLVDNDGITELSHQKKIEIYNKYISRRFEINLLQGTEGMAQAPGFFLGMGNHKFNQFYPDENGRLNTGAVRTWAHEIGHNIGYSHSSNMTYEKDINHDGNNDGATVVWKKVYTELFEKNELPFMKNPFE